MSFAWALLTVSVALGQTAEIIEVRHRNSPIEIKLKAVQLANTLWTRADIESELRATNLIYAQCGIQIKEVKILMVSSSGVLSKYDEIESLGKNLVTIEFREPTELTVIFAGRLAGPILNYS